MSSLRTPDLYRDSFKYFKSYVINPTISPQYLSRSNRKIKVTKSLSLRSEQESEMKDVTATGNTKSEQLVKNGSEVDEGHDHEIKSSSASALTREDILLPHFHDQEDGSGAFKDGIVKRDILYDSGCKCHQTWGLRSPETWDIVELTFPSGLILIRNPFTPVGQRYWISRTLLDFPHHPEFITNMDNLNRLEKKQKGESVNNLKDFKLDTCSRNFYEKLRWVTFGYHHDWDTKVYSEDRRSNFPEDLADMTRYIAQVLGFSDFEAEAAIANYYHMDSTLSGHVDHSEVNQWAPLFSLSFGQTAIFLIGGKTRAERPQPVLLRSGDIAVMSGESRLSYHGVPKILLASSKPWVSGEIIFHHESESIRNCGLEVTDNMYKRPKMDNEFDQKLDKYASSSASSFHDCSTFNPTLRDEGVQRKLQSISWTHFLDNYINKSRINLNIRQVLFPGQRNLYSDTSTNSK